MFSEKKCIIMALLIILPDLSETLRALVDINQRYDVIGERLGDRRGETKETLGKVVFLTFMK